MKILVGYKRVVDFNVRIQVKPDGSGVVTDGVKLSANPFDDIALEEALRLREKGVAEEVVLVTIGPADAQAHIRNGLAMGANRAIHVVTSEAIQPLTAPLQAPPSTSRGTSRKRVELSAVSMLRCVATRASLRACMLPAIRRFMSEVFIALILLQANGGSLISPAELAARDRNAAAA